MTLFSRFGFGKRKESPARNRPSVPARLTLEALEERSLPSCNSISGYVFLDGNNNGILDAGETKLGGSAVQLQNASGQVIATTTSDSSGYYSFSTDSTVDQTPATLSFTADFADTATNWSATKGIQQFDPSLGTLTSVDITVSDPMTNTIKVENLDTASATIHASVIGSATLSGPGVVALTTNLNANQSFSASAFDGTIDFGGSSGHNFGPQTTQGSNSVTLTAAGDLQGYIGTGSVNFTEAAQGSATASGSANLLLSVNTTASAHVTVKYHYIPSNCLKPGNYLVVQTSEPPGTLDGKESIGTTVLPNSVGQDTIPVTLGDTDATNNNFGEIHPASIAGYVYVDTNNNGIKDAGESPIAGTTINLTGTNDLGASISLSQQTAADGSYLFGNLRPGTYALNEVQPANYLDGKDAVGSQGGTLANDQLSNLSLAASQNGLNNNFGEQLATSISGYVYVDANNNGIKDAGENGIPGTTVKLTGTNDLGAAVNLTQQTGLDGSYNFGTLRPGTYQLNEIQPASYLDGKDAVGSQGGTTANDQLSNLQLAGGQSGVNNNFGELLPANIGGYVYVDANNNGIKDAGETAIPGTTVTLTGTNDLGTAVNLSQQTAGDGSYNFGNLRPGSYQLSETQPSAYLDGKDAVGTQGGVTGNDQLTGLQLVTGQSGLNNNFGELLPAGLAGFVYLDANNNGVKDPGEAGIGGAAVGLTGTDDLGHAVYSVHTTGADGSYSFTGLRPGTYALNEAQPNGYWDGKDAVGSQGGTLGNDQLTGIGLGMSVNGVNNNFGEVLPTKIGGYVYLDANNNGVKDAGETGIANAAVALTGTDDQGQAVYSVVQTGADGSYNFTNLRPGTYALNEAQPAGYLDGKDAVGSQGGTAGNDQFTNINLVTGAAGVNNNFGEVLPAKVSGFVYLDANDNGVKDAGETGIGSTPVALTGTDDQGHSVYSVVLTAADGSYAFTGLRPGQYNLNEAQPGGYLDGKDAVGSQGGALGNDQVTGLNLAMGSAGVNNNFGELLPASLSGYVYVDANNNGVKDAGEAGIGGTAVALTGTDDQGHNVYSVVLTSGDGSYGFGNLRPGQYNLYEAQPAGYADGKDALGSQGGTLGNDQLTGIGLGMSVNGVNNNFGEIQGGSSLSGYVYLDVNKNGIRVATDPPLPGVQVTLTGVNVLGQQVSQSTTTGADGSYGFGNLLPGTYALKETQPGNLDDGIDTIGTPGGTTTNDQFANIVLPAAYAGVNNNFGEQLPPDHVVPTPPDYSKLWLFASTIDQFNS